MSSTSAPVSLAVCIKRSWASLPLPRLSCRNFISCLSTSEALPGRPGRSRFLTHGRHLCRPCLRTTGTLVVPYNPWPSVPWRRISNRRFSCRGCHSHEIRGRTQGDTNILNKLRSATRIHINWDLTVFFNGELDLIAHPQRERSILKCIVVQLSSGKHNSFTAMVSIYQICFPAWKKIIWRNNQYSNIELKIKNNSDNFLFACRNPILHTFVPISVFWQVKIISRTKKGMKG